MIHETLVISNIILIDRDNKCPPTISSKTAVFAYMKFKVLVSFFFPTGVCSIQNIV